MHWLSGTVRSGKAVRCGTILDDLQISRIDVYNVKAGDLLDGLRDLQISRAKVAECDPGETLRIEELERD